MMHTRVLTALLVLALLVGSFAGFARQTDAAPNAALDTYARTVTLLSSTALTTTGTGTAATGFGPADLLRVQADCSAVTGTTPSATFTLQDSVDGTNWNTVVAFTAITAVSRQVVNYAEVRAATAQAFGDQLRISYVVSGTTPSLTCSIVVFAQG